MSNTKTDIEYFDFILTKINDIESFIKKYEKISVLLKDTMGRDASLMCLLQVGETLNKLNNNYKSLDKDDIKGAYDVRNFIAHDYMGVDLGFIEAIIRVRLPQLKQTIELITQNLGTVH